MTAPALHSLEAEQSVLGACMGWPDASVSIHGMLSVGDFHREDHQLIYRALSAIAADGQPVDTITVAERLEAQGKLNDAGGLPYLVRLVENTPGAANAEAYALIVKNRSLKRQIALLCNQVSGAAATVDARTMIADLQGGLDTLTRSGIGTSLDFVDVLLRADEAISEAGKAAAAGNTMGVPTGLPALDRRIGGLPRKRLIILAGRPSLGKTALAQQIALNAAKCGHAIGICSLEMGADELGIRAYANVLDVNGTALQFGDRDAVEEYTKKLQGHPMSRYRIFVDDFTYSLSGIIARAQEWKHKHGIGLLIIDYLQLIEGLEGDTQSIRIGTATRALKKLAKRVDIPILLLSQLNRDLEKQKRRPLLSDLRDSGSIEQDCDVALFLHADAEETEGLAHIEIGALKTRYGRRGWLPQSFQFDGRTQKFIELCQAAA